MYLPRHLAECKALSICSKQRLEASGDDDAGPDPVRAMTDINRLRLFPAVFTVTLDAEAKLPSNWGEPCVQLVTAASATLAAVNFQVSVFVQMPVHVKWCICQPCEVLIPHLMLL